MKTAKWIVVAVVILFLVYCAYVALIHFPVEIKSSQSPDGLEATLLARPNWSNPFSYVLLPFQDLQNNVYVYVEVRDDSKVLKTIVLAEMEDAIIDYEDTELTWSGRNLTVIDSNSGKRETSGF